MFGFVSFRGRAQVLLAAAGAFSLSFTAIAGPYSGPTDTANAIDPAIASGSPLFQEWADAIDASRTAFAPEGSTVIDETGGFNSLGDLTQAQIDNGDPVGFLTVTFPNGVRNGSGADFAVFENGFGFGSPNGLFAELAYVEVSSNGQDFARFPSISTNVAPVVGSNPFAGYDTSNIFNLAGKHAGGFGTPFDLDDLLTDPLVTSGDVDLDDIQYVRLVDIPGSGDFLDSQGNPILDNWHTTGTGGFDFRLGEGLGVGVINVVPEPTSMLLLAGGLGFLARRRR